MAFTAVGLNWEDFVLVDPALYRPAEVDLLVGDASRAREHLGWRPTIGFHDLVGMMVEADLALVANDVKRGAIRRPSDSAT